MAEAVWVRKPITHYYRSDDYLKGICKFEKGVTT